MRVGRGWVLHGSPGTGKTLTAALIAKSALFRRRSVCFSIFSTLIDQYAKGWKSVDDQLFFEDHFRGADLLVIDDLGREGTQTARVHLAIGIISNMIRDRVQHQLSTYITTNLNLEQIQDGYGADIASLFREAFTVHHYVGADWRAANQNRVDSELRLKLSRPVTFGVVAG
jgi:DNA replication protein DnaC